MSSPKDPGFMGRLGKFAQTTVDAVATMPTTIGSAFSPESKAEPAGNATFDTEATPSGTLPRSERKIDDVITAETVYSKIALAKVAKVAKILRSHGYHSAAWQDFNTSLIAVGRRRFSGNTNVMLGVKYLASDVVSSLPPAGGDPRSAFLIWTLICFLLGAVCSLGTAFGSSSLWFALLRLLVLLVAGYAIAYTLFFGLGHRSFHPL